MINPYPLELQPGKSKTIQLLNADGSSYSIPVGTTVVARVANALKSPIVQMTASIADGLQGLVTVTLPDTTTVRGLTGKEFYWDMMLTLPNSQRKYLPVSTIKFMYSPSHPNP